MSTQWCCRILHEEFGPMDLDELRELALSGTLSAGDLVRRDSDDVWTSASKCPELRATFGKLEPALKTPAVRHATASPVPSKKASNEQSPLRDEPPNEEITRRDVAFQQLSDPTTPRQRWIAWSATASVMLVLFFADRQITSATPTFPQPRQVREKLAAQHWFLGTGPWSRWECRLLWLDTLVVLSFTSGWVTRKLTR